MNKFIPQDNNITFQAQIREVRSKILVSNDKEIKIILTTADLNALRLAEIDGDRGIEVSIKLV